MLEGKTVSRMGKQLNYPDTVLLETTDGEVWVIKSQKDGHQHIFRVQDPVIRFLEDESHKCGCR